MDLTWDFVVSILSILSVPLHVLLMAAMCKIKKYFSRGFYAVIMHLSVCHIIISVIKVIVTMPSNYPPVREFLDDHSTLNWLVGIISTNRGYSLKWVMQGLLAIIALNRLAAVLAPMAFHKKNNAMVTLSCYAIWIIFIGVRLPVIWPLHLTVYHPIDSPQRTVYNLEEKGFTTFSIWVSIFVGVSSLIITYLSYMIIVIKVFVSHVFGNDHMKPQVRRSVIVACVSTIGLFVMCFVEAAEEVYWRLWTVDFVQTDTFYFLVNTGYEYSVWSLPISMIGMFPELRQQIIRLLRFRKNKINVIKVSGSNGSPTRLTP